MTFLDVKAKSWALETTFQTLSFTLSSFVCNTSNLHIYPSLSAFVRILSYLKPTFLQLLLHSCLCSSVLYFSDFVEIHACKAAVENSFISFEDMTFNFPFSSTQEKCIEMCMIVAHSLIISWSTTVTHMSITIPLDLEKSSFELENDVIFHLAVW